MFYYYESSCLLNSEFTRDRNEYLIVQTMSRRRVPTPYTYHLHIIQKYYEGVVLIFINYAVERRNNEKYVFCSLP